MTKTHRSKLWPHFKPVEGKRYYRCVHCGEIVPKEKRWRHLLTKHPLIWAEIESSLREE